MGFAYSLANASVQRAVGDVGHRAGLLYLASTLGAVVGSLVTGFVLLPTLGMQRSVTILIGAITLGLVPLYLASQ